MPAVLARLVILLTLLSGAAQAQQAQFPIADEDGAPMANHALRPDQMAEIAHLPGLVDVGRPDADVTLYQFYDLNCPYCREAAADVDTLLRSDPRLRLVFAPYAVLSAASVEGARVEFALRQLGTPQQFLEFHRRIYSGRGRIDGNRALAVAQSLGFDRNALIEIADTGPITETLTIHAKVGFDAKLMVTPAYVIQGVAILGHPGLESLRRVIASVRQCGAVAC
jgi:protein-disulfide isomerase